MICCKSQSNGEGFTEHDMVSGVLDIRFLFFFNFILFPGLKDVVIVSLIDSGRYSFVVRILSI